MPGKRVYRHLDGSTEFPDADTVDVWRYRNEFDYDRWGDGVRVSLLNVPWDATFSDVPGFEGDAERDAYLDAKVERSVVLKTWFHMRFEDSVRVPIPEQDAQVYNYCIVDLPVPPNGGAPLDYAGSDGIMRWCYFVAGTRYVSPSATEMQLSLDVWVTAAGRVKPTYANLLRGHYPMAQADADEYLANPRGKAEWLLAPDASAEAAPVYTSYQKPLVLNQQDVIACICTNADLRGDWGSMAEPKTPGRAYVTEQGILAPRCYGLPIDELDDFLEAVETQAPTFKSTVLGVFFVGERYVMQMDTFSFCGHTLKVVSAHEVSEPLLSLTKGAFGYPEEVSGIAKLYTWPYAALRVTNGNGESTLVRVEETDGELDAVLSYNLVCPFVRMDARLVTIGGVSGEVRFDNAPNPPYGTEREFAYGGRWYETLLGWDVPVMQVTQSSEVHAEWSTAYQRAHDALSAKNVLDSANASATMTRANSRNSAQNTTDNNALMVAYNTAASDTLNDTEMSVAQYQSATSDMLLAADNRSVTAAYNAEQDGLAVASTNNALNTLLTGIGGIIMTGVGLATFNPIVAAGGAATTIGAISSGIQGDSSNVVSQSNSEAIYTATIASNADRNSVTKGRLIANAAANQSFRTSDTNLKNTMSNGIAANSASLVRTNADNNYSTETANAQRAYETAMDAVRTALDKAGQDAQPMWGAASNQSQAATRPQGLFTSVVTQSPSAIAYAANAFLRYGYALDRQVEVTTLNVMPSFSYWQCDKMYFEGAQRVTAGMLEAIRGIFADGVTVWRDPDDIGTASVYANAG